MRAALCYLYYAALSLFFSWRRVKLSSNENARNNWRDVYEHFCISSRPAVQSLGKATNSAGNEVQLDAGDFIAVRECGSGICSIRRQHTAGKRWICSVMASAAVEEEKTNWNLKTLRWGNKLGCRCYDVWLRISIIINRLIGSRYLGTTDRGRLIFHFIRADTV